MADREPVTLRVQGFPQEMVGNPATIEEGWMPFFVSADYPFRMIAACVARTAVENASTQIATLAPS